MCPGEKREMTIDLCHKMISLHLSTKKASLTRQYKAVLWKTACYLGYSLSIVAWKFWLEDFVGKSREEISKGERRKGEDR